MFRQEKSCVAALTSSCLELSVFEGLPSEPNEFVHKPGLQNGAMWSEQGIRLLLAAT